MTYWRKLLVGAPAPVESLGYAHNVLLVSGAGVAHEVVGLDHRCCPSQALCAERHDNEPPRRQRRRVDDADAFKHLHVGLGIIEVSLREPIRPLRRREHGDALLAVFILDIVEAPAPRLPIRLAPHADDVEMFFGLHAPPHNRGPGYPEGYPGPSCTLYALASLRAAAAEVKRVLLGLLARLGVEDDLRERYPAIVAGVGCFFRFPRWVWFGCGRVIHVDRAPFC